jgi:nicotinate-nucleotide pyrophosphorylase (carboxylating)
VTAPAPLPRVLLEPIVRRALEEDLGRAGDVTAALLGPSERLRAHFVARASGVVAGLECAALACALVDPGIAFTTLRPDASSVSAGETIATVEGPARAILTAERTALNFLTLLSGVATLTAAFVAQTEGTDAKIAATRKTLPGLRAVQKHAVLCGGGWPHRYGLDDAILIKDNHIAACGSVGEALRRARAAAGHMVVIEVEVDRLAQLEEALGYKPDVVLLDNFSLDDLRAAVAMAKGRAVLEASGGVSLASVRAIAQTGVDVISAGALTHSAPAFDIGLDAA